MNYLLRKKSLLQNKAEKKQDLTQLTKSLRLLNQQNR